MCKCAELIGKKTDGTSDAYVTARWDGVTQSTRVVRGTTSPAFEETLYFPVKLVRVTVEEMAKKGVRE